MNDTKQPEAHAAQPARECLQQSAEPGSREAQMVVIKRGAYGVPTVWCDPEIADIVRALNEGGAPTVASCSGHGEKFGGISLSDGRQLMVIPTLGEFIAALATLQAAPPASAGMAVPAGFALVPSPPTPAMDEVLRELDWQWEDLLAAAEAITVQEYAALAAAPRPPAAQEGKTMACACGDEFPVDSYGAGFLDAKGMCFGCDAAETATHPTGD